MKHRANARRPLSPSTISSMHFKRMWKFWKSLRSWNTDSAARNGKVTPVGELKVPVGETGWGSKAPRTKAHQGDLKVPAGELGWGSRAPKTRR